MLPHSTTDVAHALLGQTLTVNHPYGQVGGIITETEAYTQDDPACHAYGGKKSPRNSAMFLPAGHVYIYFIYGMYHCLNIVTEEEGRGCAVLIRAIMPTIGIPHIQNNRGPGVSYKNLANGPGKLMIALGIDPSWNGSHLHAPNCPITLLDTRMDYPGTVLISSRIGITKGKDLLWRYELKLNPQVRGAANSDILFEKTRR
jgi:DNA-3-methyladenine glycosylase